MALVLIALGLRLIYLLLLDDPFHGTPVRDAAAYDAWARRILDGVGRERPFFADPLYAYLLAGVYRLAGLGEVTALLIGQAILDALNVAVIYGITRRAFGDRFAALCAAALAALLEPYVAYAAAPLKTSLSVFLVNAALLLALVAAERRTLRAALGFGLAAGLATLTRPNVLLILATFSGWAWLAFRADAQDDPERAGQGTRPRLAVFVAAAWLGTAAVIAPITITNVVRSSELVLISANFGHNLYLGNHPGNPRSGLHLSPHAIQGNPLTEEEEWHREAERRAGETLTARQRETFWLGEALRTIAQAPQDFAIRTAHKALLLLNAYEIPDNRNVYLYRRYVPWIARGPTPLVTLGLALSLALLGVLAAVRRPGAPRFLLLAAATYAASLLPFVVSSRYRLPLMGPLLPFAGFALFHLRSRVRAARAARPGGLRGLGSTLAAFALLFALVHLPLVDAGAYFGRDCYDLAVLHNRAAEYDQARDRALEALERDPNLQQAWIELGIALKHLGQPDEAAVAFTRATRGRSDIAGLGWLNLALLERARGRVPAARTAARRATPLLDWNPPAQARAVAIAGAPFHGD